MGKNAVAYTVTGSHIQLTAASLASLCQRHTAAEHLDVVIIATDVTGADVAAIRQIPVLFDQPNVYVTVWQPPAQAQHIQPTAASARFPVMTFWRLFLPAYFPQFTRLLYIDNDTLFYRDVSEIFPLLADDRPVAAVPDFYYYALANDPGWAESLHLASSRQYVNSGVILFNVARFNRQYSVPAIVAAINANRDPYPDQAVLNRLTADQMVRLPLTCNYQKDDHWLHDWARTAAPDQFPAIAAARDQVLVRHFVEFGPHSLPWQHLTMTDPWERDWWHTLSTVKARLAAADKKV